MWQLRILTSPSVVPQLGLKTNPPPIQEKPAKSNKKAPPTKEELRKMTVSSSSTHFLFSV